MNSINKLRRVLGAAMVAPPTMNEGKNNPPPGSFSCYMFAWFTGPGFGTIYLQNVANPDGLPLNIPATAYDADGNDQVNYPTSPPEIEGAPSNGRWRLIPIGSNTPLDTVVTNPDGTITITPPPSTNEPCRKPELLAITYLQILEATVCGEAANEGAEGKSLVLTIAKNRAVKTGGNASTVLPPGLAGGILPDQMALIRELLKDKAFSCWNDKYPGNAAAQEAAGSYPRSSQTAFQKRMNFLSSFCRGGNGMAGVTVAIGRKALQTYGMTKEESEQTYLYLNPAKASKKAGKWAEDTINSANRHPDDTYWTDNIRDYLGRIHKATLVRIGRHVFVSSPGLTP